MGLHADRMQISGLAIAKADDADSAFGRPLIEHRLDSISDADKTLELLFGAFLERRLSDRWPTISQRIKAWIRGNPKTNKTSAPKIDVVTA